MVWTFGAFNLFIRLGGNRAFFAIIAWLFAREIEQTATYAPLVLALSVGLFAFAVYRLLMAVTVASRGVPVEGAFYAYDFSTHKGEGTSRMRRVNFTYEFEGQQYKGKSTWGIKRIAKDMPLYTKIPLVVDPQRPQRAYWVQELPELFERAYGKN